ncbi:hypothetical protein PYCCODRAFT_1474296 [Trametes coccinea BRFM310]|uniref:Uncharacterized protein n=1 Tax=Trametes coccinea (strain BRFM310) TaxID=1353009 RepID=A0A1Y2J1V6_TRAC3|nr:hypothetical protein PYCCODRAFT_1474296 [Trametes coccinea BRFM310]
MAVVANAPPQGAERDFTIHQRGLVETCFEENQYEAAISVLDEIRSSKFKPFPPHIRQLIYIALYPPPSSDDELEEEAMKLEPGSPSKALSRRNKSTTVPSPRASAAARDLLMKFARTNSPASLARALPGYSENPDAAAPAKYDIEDSWIAHEALRIQRVKCCWEILKEGFIVREGVQSFPSPRKPRNRRATRSSKYEEDGLDDEETPAPVSGQAWGVLDWLLIIFERDEMAMEQSEQVRYSPLLLNQIPATLSDRGARWDVGSPLDVAFHAIQQESELQRRLGVRLLTLLVNLGSTTLLDFPMFLNAVSTRMTQMSLDTLTYLLSALPITQEMAQFKVHLCRHALGGATTHGRTKPRARPRAQPRRRPRAETADVPASGDAPSSSQGISMTTAQASSADAGTTSVRRKYPAISTLDILELVSLPDTSDMAFAPQALCLKGELIANYGLLQKQLGRNERDAKWLDILRDGGLQKVVEDAFNLQVIKKVTDSEARLYVERCRVALLALVSVWQS